MGGTPHLGGKDSAYLYLTRNKRFVVKQIDFAQLRTLLKILPTYSTYLSVNPGSSIAHYLGAYVIVTPMGTKIPFVVMSNVFYSSRRIQEQYDLKGSWEDRRVLPKNIHANKDCAFGETLKDTDLRNLGTKVRMAERPRAAALEQIKRDAMFLESHSIMDYSLLLGIHHRRRGVEEHIQDEERPPCIFLIGDDRLYYFGIIDALQRWNWRKKLERFCKTYFLLQDSLGVSSVDPETYRERFVLGQEDLLVPRDAGTKYVRQSHYGAISVEVTPAGRSVRDVRGDGGFDMISETHSVASSEDSHYLIGAQPTFRYR